MLKHTLLLMFGAIVCVLTTIAMYGEPDPTDGQAYKEAESHYYTLQCDKPIMWNGFSLQAIDIDGDNRLEPVELAQMPKVRSPKHAATPDGRYSPQAQWRIRLPQQQIEPKSHHLYFYLPKESESGEIPKPRLRLCVTIPGNPDDAEPVCEWQQKKFIDDELEWAAISDKSLPKAWIKKCPAPGEAEEEADGPMPQERTSGQRRTPRIDAMSEATVTNSPIDNRPELAEEPPKPPPTPPEPPPEPNL